MTTMDVSNPDCINYGEENCSLNFASSDVKALHDEITQAKDKDSLVQKEDTRKSYQEQIKELVNQLKINEELHEEALKEHQVILVKKQQLIDEKKAAIESMKRSHEKNIKLLTQSQQQALSSCQMQHDMEVVKLRCQLERQEKEAKNTAVEQLLNDFEQEQHTRRIYDTDAFFTALAPSPIDRNPITNKNTPYVRPLYIPTYAISWPAPPPLSSLRKPSLVYSKED